MSKTKWHGKVIPLVVTLLVVALALGLSSSPVVVLAAPAVASVTQTAFSSDTTTHNVSMPATVNAGDLLIVLFTNDGSATVTIPAGWTQLASTVNSDQVRLSVYYKIAAGTEGGTTVNFVTSASEQAAAQVYRITNWHGTTPPEISTAATNTTVAPDPASLNPAGWDVANTLWLAVAGQDQGGVGVTYPTSYTDGISTASSTTGTGRCRTFSARRTLAAASENPGAFTIGAPEEWVAFTIAVRPEQRNLTTNSTEGGSVSTPGEGVFSYDEGRVVDLVATSDAGYRFVNWTGDVDDIDDVWASETTITMNGNYSITANFLAIYDLTINSTEGGSVTEPGEGLFTYDEGTVVDLIAEAEECYEFVRWTGDVESIADIYAASTNITMDAAKNVTANFALLSYNLTADSTDGGSVTAPEEGTFTYDCGTIVDLVAEADACYEFVNWTGNVSTITDIYAASTNITMNGDYSITATFAPIDCDYLDGWVANGSNYTACNGTQVCTYQDMVYLDYECVGGQCVSTETDSRTDLIGCQSCDDSDPCTIDTCENGQCVHTPIDCDYLDGWVANGSNYTACNGTQVCTYQDMVYLDYECVGGQCVSTETDSRTDLIGCESCDDSDPCTIDTCENGVCVHTPIDCDYLDGWVADGSNYTACNGTQVCTYQDMVYLDYECVGGDCVPTETDWRTDLIGCQSCDDQDPCTIDTCENGQCVHSPIDCDYLDGWVADGSNYTACNGTQVCTYQDMVYLDYECVGGDCVPTETDWRTDLIGCQSCDDNDPCTIDTCENGVCVHTPIDCDYLDGWVADGGNYTACNGTQVCTYQDMVYLDYECVGGDCVPTETDWRTDLIGCQSCDDGNPCTIDTCENGQCVHTPIYADILEYYRSLNGARDVVDTLDLLAAADDWIYNVVPACFEEPITTLQLLQLADEWIASG